MFSQEARESSENVNRLIETSDFEKVIYAENTMIEKWNHRNMINRESPNYFIWKSIGPNKDFCVTTSIEDNDIRIKLLGFCSSKEKGQEMINELRDFEPNCKLTNYMLDRFGDVCSLYMSAKRDRDYADKYYSSLMKKDFGDALTVLKNLTGEKNAATEDAGKAGLLNFEIHEKRSQISKDNDLIKKESELYDDLLSKIPNENIGLKIKKGILSQKIYPSLLEKYLEYEKLNLPRTSQQEIKTDLVVGDNGKMYVRRRFLI